MTHETISGSGDSLGCVAGLSALMYGRHQAEIRHQLTRRTKPSNVTKFRNENHRRQRIHTTESSQYGNLFAIRILLGDGQNLLINFLESALLAGQVPHQMVKGEAV
jgi:hypothetical protein